MNDGHHITRIWFQVEFYSMAQSKWIALFGKNSTEEEARDSLEQLKRGRSRIVRVIQTTEVMCEQQGSQIVRKDQSRSMPC
jgi:hypothetical protein